MVAIIRFLTGYVRFRISGSRPGSFVNKLIKNGINVWDIRSVGGEIVCCTSCAEYPLVQDLCRRTSQRVHIVKKRGVPFFAERNKKRSGLAVGFACFLLIFKLLSMYIWTVDICEFDTISQTAAKDILHRVGIYEGVRGDFESLKRMQTTAMLEFGNLSWMTINADGSRGEVNATEKELPETNDTAPRNMTARADGQVIRADAYSGAVNVAAGDGVTEGDLLISGVVQTELGGVRFTRADGVVIAKTRYLERISVPKECRIAECDEQPSSRCSARLFGAVIPLTFCTAPADHVSMYSEQQASFMGERASLSLIREDIYPYKVKTVKVDKDTAEILMKNKMLLRELFKFSDKNIVSRTTEMSENNSAYLYEVRYICEEDIAAPSPILSDGLNFIQEEEEDIS